MKKRVLKIVAMLMLATTLTAATSTHANATKGILWAIWYVWFGPTQKAPPK